MPGPLYLDGAKCGGGGRRGSPDAASAYFFERRLGDRGRGARDGSRFGWGGGAVADAARLGNLDAARLANLQREERTVALALEHDPAQS
ncbi:MAG: hypothetical protein DIU78_014180 [Pseudomonadota bacterium]